MKRETEIENAQPGGQGVAGYDLAGYGPTAQISKYIYDHPGDPVAQPRIRDILPSCERAIPAVAVAAAAAAAV